MILHLQGKVAFVSAYGIHQLHIFIFMLAVFHILQCIVTLALGRTNIAYPERFRLAKDTTFGQRHLNTWKSDYFALRHGFITAHLAPGSDARFDFQKYIKRSLDEDFKIILLVGAKLQMIITKMGLKITDRGEVVKGAPVVVPGDDLFWFNRPGLLLFLIHLVLFQNAFQLAFFSWSTYEFSINSCFHETTEDIVIRLMGSTMKPTIFNQRVASALKNWHNTAKKHVKNSKHTTPFSSRPSTPQYGMSPIHLLHRHLAGRSESAQTSPRTSNYENEQWDVEGSPSPSHHAVAAEETQMQVFEPGSSSAPELPISSQLDIRISSSEFSFEKRHTAESD
ncbi:MLO-like protein 2 [Glycine max]|nr:MLO-like protein 2 [Glycine max]